MSLARLDRFYIPMLPFEPMLIDLVESVSFLGDRIGSVDMASVSKAARRCRRKEEGSNPADDLFIFRLYSVSSPT